MIPTSKPVVTPEMVEKARQFYAQDMGIGAANYATEVGRLEGQVRYRIELMARFAASAVQDAVSDCADHVDKMAHALIADAKDYSIVQYALERAAAALREKYGVKE